MLATLFLSCESFFFFFFSSRRRHTRFDCDWSSDVCSSDLLLALAESVLYPLDPELGFVQAGGRRHAQRLFHQRLGSAILRSEERRVGKECRSRWSPYH